MKLGDAVETYGIYSSRAHDVIELPIAMLIRRLNQFNKQYQTEMQIRKNLSGLKFK